MTKESYLKTTLYGGYMEYSNISTIQGMAYGWKDVGFARASMMNTRNEHIKVKEWGNNITLERMVRDAKLYAAGARSGFEGAKLVRDFYPDQWWKLKVP
eukprot:CAMPEP_0173088726 /NCGR_PEP_ID=MMETSP1102-20130122/25210_1 /TAXON_ID=49646 /ORGANISM="Geminigera sp., Strain Caron Lab Isolate" /LENGTH=98 /DNA_ID=CAMNT_0013971893 /DNA_START=1004 /DNA_END=1300 /DNA_ORIENTATION=+